MKKCVKCGENYDNTWKVCLKCGVDLMASDSMHERGSEPKIGFVHNEESIFWPKTKERAAKTVKYASYFMYFILGRDALGIIIQGLTPMAIVIWIVVFILVFTIHKFKSRISTTILGLILVIVKAMQLIAAIAGTYLIDKSVSGQASEQIMANPILISILQGILFIGAFTVVARAIFVFHGTSQTNDRSFG